MTKIFLLALVLNATGFALDKFEFHQDDNDKLISKSDRFMATENVLDTSLNFLEDISHRESSGSKDLPLWLGDYGVNSTAEYLQLGETMRQVEKSRQFPIALSDENVAKNRYKNVLPTETSRVLLRSRSSDYINANWVTHKTIPNFLDVDAQPYIVTQAPLPSTIEDFWHMVWHEQVHVVVMLTRFLEKGMQKASPYWEPQVDKQLVSGSFTITTKNVRKLGNITVTALVLTHAHDSRVVYHLHYEEWPDFGVPLSTDEMRLLIKLTDQCLARGAVAPAVIHCSAGLGRAGTFIALKIAIKNYEKHQKAPKIFDIVSELRQARAAMVQSLDQYHFIFRVVKDWISNETYFSHN